MKLRIKKAIVWGTSVLATAVVASVSLTDNGLAIVYGEDANFFAIRILHLLVGSGIFLVNLYVQDDAISQLRREVDRREALQEKLEEVEMQAVARNKEIALLMKAMSEQKVETFSALREILGSHLKFQARKLFNDDAPPHFRITVYSHRRDSESFSQVGRYSPRPEYNQIGRSTYALNSGSIGVAWQNGTCNVPTLPNPETEFDIYANELRTNWNMSDSEIQDLTMKSRAMRAVRLLGGRTGGEFVGVLLIETTQASLSAKLIELLQIIRDDIDEIMDTVIHHEYELHKKMGPLLIEDKSSQMPLQIAIHDSA